MSSFFLYKKIRGTTNETVTSRGTTYGIVTFEGNVEAPYSETLNVVLITSLTHINVIPKLVKYLPWEIQQYNGD